MFPEELRRSLEHQHYKLAGRHSAVKLCHWTKKSLRGEGVCYKQLFYGIESHRCLQMSPDITCMNKCVYCWRVIERTAGFDKMGVDEPGEIIDTCVEAQRLLISGFGGFKGTDAAKFREAQNPKHAAISLMGEPTLYPKISELIEEFHKRRMTTFLVTNGQLPDRLENITEPFQFYLSLDAPDRETYKKIDRPGFPDFWERLERSLELMSSMSCRKVARLTMVKNWNMKDPEGYAKLIEKANPTFIEVKGYMHVGESQKRLPREAMPRHQEIKDFAEEISKATGFRHAGEQQSSRVVLLKG